jgi:SAM-dependent methyltransferase
MQNETTGRSTLCKMDSTAWRRRARTVLPRGVRHQVSVRGHKASLWIRGRGDPVRMKRAEEMAFWRGVFRRDGRPSNDHFAALFQQAFGLTSEFYAGKRLLDVGCGPAGSLDWATMAAERVGVDPLVGQYRSLGIEEKRMRYVEAKSEELPFEDKSFDVVSSLNSLDHVEDVRRTIAEMVRVLAVNGSLLLVVEVNHEPTITEPVSLPWEIPAWFGSSMRTVLERRYESSGPGWFFGTVFADRLWDDTRAERRPGILLARFEKLRHDHDRVRGFDA